MRMKADRFYKLRNGIVVGPTEQWNPILVVAPIPVTLQKEGAPPHLTFMMDGESTYDQAFDAVKELRIR